LLTVLVDDLATGICRHVRVKKPVWKADEIRGKPVSADMTRLPDIITGICS
jgi:hypothetical protein